MNPIRANATDIDQWADRREAQATLPRLIRRLILASVKRVERLHFRSEEGVQLAGWDGIVQVPVGNAYVPDGLSGWELSTRSDARGKADDDYETRSNDPLPLDAVNASFVSVTARRWSHKEKWADEKNHEGVWKDVRAFDADDLDAWLEQAPAVDLWFSIFLGKRPVGVIDLNSFWDSWSRATRPQLIPDLVMAGREDNIHQIHQWLRSGPSIQGLQADTQDEAIAYFIASLFRLQEEEQERVFARAIVVEDATTWRQLALCDYPLILIPIFSDRSMVAAAIEKGHSVLYPLNRSEPCIGNTILLSRIRREEAKKALIAMGVHELRARDLAAPFLPLLAEATPEVFLETIDNDLSSKSPSLVHLFTDSEDHFNQSSPHTGLLWALEVLAWSPEYLGQSALLLAKLVRMDPGGKLTNRPLGSLQNIFLACHPCTTANLERRLRILDTIRHREPKPAWNLLVSVLPLAHCVAFPTDKPKYRNWLPEEDIPIPFAEELRASAEVVHRILEDVGTDGTRWRTVIELLDELPKIDFEAIAEHLLALDLEAIPQPDSLMIWNALRDLLSHHLQFPDARWVLPQAATECVRKCFMRFEPADPILKISWLFSRQCSFPEGGPSRGRERENMIDQARIKAVEELFDWGGQPLLHELACKVEDCYRLGWSLSHSSAFDRQETLLLSQVLGSTEAARRAAFAGLLCGRAAVKGQIWLEGLRFSEIWKKWTMQQRADYYMLLPFVESTWDALENEEVEIQHLYWLNIGINGRGNLESKDCERVILKLADHGRLGSAVDFMALYRKKMQKNAKLVADVLDRAIREKGTEIIDWVSLAYEVGELLNLLETSNDIEEVQIGQFELYFLPLLRNHGRTPRILHKALTKNPEFFAEILEWPYMVKGEEPGSPSNERNIRIRLRDDLLQSWLQPPGINDDGCVDHEILASWVSRARELTHANGREDIADHHIGHVLAHYPIGTDGVWPHEALRDLIEDLRSDKIENGIINGISGSRGVTCRSLFEGGAQEKTIAECYLNYASALSDKWPRTARLMKKIADNYKSVARWEDRQAELYEDLMG